MRISPAVNLFNSLLHVDYQVLASFWGVFLVVSSEMFGVWHILTLQDELLMKTEFGISVLCFKTNLQLCQWRESKLKQLLKTAYKINGTMWMVFGVCLCLSAGRWRLLYCSSILTKNCVVFLRFYQFKCCTFLFGLCGGADLCLAKASKAQPFRIKVQRISQTLSKMLTHF